MAGGATERAVLTARSPAGGELLLVSLDVEEAVARRYTTPGQYIELKADSGNGYFVLASNVGERPWQLLVKNAGGAADALATQPIGTQFRVVGPLGAGFSVERMRSRHVAVAVVGSAIGVARSVIGRRIADGAATATHLFLGIRGPTDLTIPGEIAGWAANGIEVVLCLSKNELDHHKKILPGARRASGYVQHALARALETGAVPHGALVIAAGPDAMLADMRSLAAEAAGTSSTGAVLAGPSFEVLTNV
jgi:NAD(P)H-flavin reductase